jgi:hypothetical protein
MGGCSGMAKYGEIFINNEIMADNGIMSMASASIKWLA